MMFEVVLASLDGDDRCNASGSKYNSGRCELASHNNIVVPMFAYFPNAAQPIVWTDVFFCPTWQWQSGGSRDRYPDFDCSIVRSAAMNAQ